MEGKERRESDNQDSRFDEKGGRWIDGEYFEDIGFIKRYQGPPVPQKPKRKSQLSKPAFSNDPLIPDPTPKDPLTFEDPELEDRFLSFLGNLEGPVVIVNFRNFLKSIGIKKEGS